MDCRCDMRLRFIDAVYGILVFVAFDENVEEQIKNGLLATG